MTSCKVEATAEVLIRCIVGLAKRTGRKHAAEIM
jgi:hypothetical protein